MRALQRSFLRPLPAPILSLTHFHTCSQFWDRLSAQIWRINAIINPPDGPDYLTRADFDHVGAVVLEQCDEIDGLKDGLIASPLECKPDLRPIACDSAGSNSSSCLSAGKIAKMNLLYNDWYGLNNSFIYFNYLPGAEALPSFAVTGTPYSLACVPLARLL